MPQKLNGASKSSIFIEQGTYVPGFEKTVFQGVLKAQKLKTGEADMCCKRVVIFTLLFFTAHLPPAFAADGDFRKPTKVLLVGVEDYPNSDASPLPGTQNDIELFTRLFVDKMGVAESDIVTLSDRQGTQNVASYPTRANIEREFRKLAETVGEDDFVFILMGGHGTLVPERADLPSHERYGRDSVFLPRDVKWWGDGDIPNCIRDHEIGQWIHNIRKKNAFVWYVADSCHSGGGTRGMTENDETVRSVSPHVLKIPQNAFEVALQKAEQSKSSPDEALQFIPANIAFFASLPAQVTLSKNLPPNVDKEKRVNHGIFSYCLCKTLEYIVDEGIQTSYDELIKAVELQYAALPIYGRTPTPLMEGSDVSLAVFRNRPVQRKLNIRYAPETERLNIGLFHGVGAGSVLEVFDKVGEESTSLGYIRVEHESLYSSVAKPVEWNDKPITAAFPQRPLRCVPVDVQAGINPEISIAFDQSKDSYDELKKLLFANVDGPFQFKEATVEEADFLLQDAGNQWRLDHVEIVPLRSPLKMLSFGTFGGPVAVNRAEDIHENLRKIAIAHFLLKIADRSERINRTLEPAKYDRLNANVASPVTVEFSLYRTMNPGAEAESIQVGSEKTRLAWIKNNMEEFSFDTGQFIHLADKENLAVVAKDVGYNEAWFNVLVIDKDCNIHSFYYTSDGDNSISTDQEASCIVPFYIASGKTVDSDIVIAVATAEKLDLSSPGSGESPEVKIESALFSLLAQKVGGKTKGVRGVTATGYFIMKVFPVITGSTNSP